MSSGPASNDEEIAQLLDRARNGSLASLNQLLQISRPGLVELARLNLGPQLRRKAGESDIAQDVLLLVHRQFQQFRGETASEWFGWLAAISRSALISQFRRHAPGGKRDLSRESPHRPDARQPDESLLPTAGLDGPSPLAALIREEERQILECALQALSPLSREVVIRHQREGESLAQIAESLGRSPSAVQKLWHRAVKRIAHAAQPASDRR